MNNMALMFLFLISFSGLSLAQDQPLSFEELMEKAGKEDKLLMINFSGSDWCNPCIRMEKEIFSSAAFQDLMNNSILFVKADFPRSRKNKLAKDLIKRNEALANKYNQRGSFPMTILFDQEGSILNSWEGYPTKGPGQFIKEVKQFFPSKKEIGKVYNRTLILMGNRFDISVVANSQKEGDRGIDLAIQEIGRIEKLISSWDENSQTSLINKNAGLKAVAVDEELVQLIKRSKKISEITQGAFDISFGSVDTSFWRFDPEMTSLPNTEQALQSVSLINYKKIEISDQFNSVFLKEKGMRIGFGGIGKGYAAEKAKELLVSHGFIAGVINASGDMTLWGDHPVHDDWTVAIADPNLPNNIFSSMNIKNKAVVTSGNYEKFAVIDGIKYSHIIDPRTGFPASGIKSVTVIAPNAELADALATSIFVLGVDVGLNLIDQLEDTDCIIIDDKNKINYSNAITIL